MSTPFRASTIVLTLAVLMGEGARAQSTDPYETLEAASIRFAAIETFCADFDQVLSVPLLDQRNEGHGRLCQRRPNLFSMRFSEPAGDLVVLDGTHAWFYTPSQDVKQVIRTDVRAANSGVDLYGEFLEDPRQKYEVRREGRESVGGVMMERLALTPRAAVGYVEAVIWIDPVTEMLRKVFITEENGSTRTVTFSTIEVEPTLPNATFSFTPPPGTQVITR